MCHTLLIPLDEERFKGTWDDVEPISYGEKFAGVAGVLPATADMIHADTNQVIDGLQAALARTA